ncbi:MAG: hypothetical protein IT426_10995 [Pirellulales bacterium]|nr:hypothetical protein [Pirellulales bacterium]
MEPALYFKRRSILSVALFLLAALSSCTERASADSFPAAKSNKTALHPSLAEESKIAPSLSENEGEKPKTDAEIAAENAARRRAALKEIIDKLGPPLVDNAEKLKKADPLYPVWIDKKNQRVIMEGVVCQTNAPLEMFAVLSGTKEHEAIVAVPTEAHVVHAALVVVGAKPGKSVEFGQKAADYKPATGTEIEITVKWKNEKGNIQSARAQEWIKNVKTGKEMQYPWVFGGSGFWKDEQTGIEYYKAEGGDFICVSNFPSAMLDLPIESSQSNEDLMFQANPARIPPRDTPVTLILTPKLKNEAKDKPQEKPAEPETPQNKDGKIRSKVMTRN